MMFKLLATDTQDERQAMQEMLASWVAHGWLRPLDAAFANFLWHEVASAPPLLILAAALASHQLGRGHASLDLVATLNDPAFALSLPPEGISPGRLGCPSPAEVLNGVGLAQWQAALTQPSLVGAGAGNTPLVLIDHRLYLRRYWQYEQNVHAGIAHRLQQTAAVANLQQTLDMLFPAAPDGATDWQKLACALASRNAFSIITGGPGTGKTTTVVRLLALLQALELDTLGQMPLRIRLAAPTGKAAARLNAAIAGAVARLPLAELAQGEAIRAAIPLQVTTLHRLLGSRPDTRHFRHHAGNPLALDVLVVDEASMVDLEMMSALLAALPPAARLILLGDKDQLASVEAGAVLGELCQRAQESHYTPATRDWLQAVSGQTIPASLIDAAGEPLDQCVTLLRHSHRFSAGSGIGRLSAAINAGDTAGVRAIWREDYADLARLPLAPSAEASFKALVIDGHLGDAQRARHGYRHYLETMRQQPAGADQARLDAWAEAVLQAHGQFQVLCALRHGPWGVEGLNARIAHLLFAAGLIQAEDGWYPGRPVLVTRNDYGLGLMNGDIGITLAGGSDHGLRVAFPASDSGRAIKWVSTSRLQAVETVYALTVHKSQGSEFTHAALVLPDSLSPILTRELIYTGITRATTWLTLAHACSMEVMEQAVMRRVLRSGGLLR